MHFAFTLFEYLPYGGMQRNFMAIAKACVARGHSVTAFAGTWTGIRPNEFAVQLLSWKGASNHARAKRFAKKLRTKINSTHFDCVVGFNRMPGLDLYYAADTCFKEKASQEYSPLYRLTGRYRTYAAFESAVYSPTSNTEILILSEQQKINFQRWYNTPDSRFHILPPGISRDRMAPENAFQVRQDLRKEFYIAEDTHVILMVGSGFRTKGLDRAIQSLVHLPESLRKKCIFYVIGSDDPSTYQRQAIAQGVGDQVHFLSGRDDIPRFLQGADALLHPAYYENTGNVILEAIVAGLPVLATDSCGYAHFITEANCGIVHKAPFDQQRLTSQLEHVLTSKDRSLWRENGIRFGQSHDLYSRPEFAAKIIERHSELIRGN